MKKEKAKFDLVDIRFQTDCLATRKINHDFFISQDNSAIIFISCWFALK